MKMNTNILFESEEEKNATLKVLGAFKVKSLNGDIDTLISEILKYAKKIDDLLEENGFTRRYLDRAGSLSENSCLSLDEDLSSLDFRSREVIDDLIKRINTRVKLICDEDKKLKAIEEEYDLNMVDLEKEIKSSRLSAEYFI
jgi:hypothetical protein